MDREEAGMRSRAVFILGVLLGLFPFYATEIISMAWCTTLNGWVYSTIHPLYAIPYYGEKWGCATWTRYDDPTYYGLP